MQNNERKGLYGIWGTSESNLYAVGIEGTILQYDGTRWETLPFSTEENLSDIWISNRSDIYITGTFGTILIDSPDSEN
jgi:hypothetical protein